MSIEAARELLIGNGTTPLKLEYFAIEGVAEPVRIALSVADVPFDDVGIDFKDWFSTKKATTKYGVVPEMTLPDGSLVTESKAMLRLAGEADPEGKLFPADVRSRLKVEMTLGLVADLDKAWNPAMYVGMRPQKFGYPPKEEWSEGETVIKKLRTEFVTNELPRFMGYFADLIKESGGKFLCGENLTIADIAAYQGIGYYRRGIADHVPKDCLDKFPEIIAYLGRVEAHPKVAAYKASKAK
mmetsp:Transcript_12850/g.23096  ORF Transcript_12850/g.23096 Transcript_12850/m.23096 type:complete len:241 (-) Transcript_12850:175-897(-)|eukprot:CAMPEP_0196141128 /NCGR_PEP_ID=MMETSP0910-20130528/8791_1 /TAXON_ID=49265 /ORGANISM="Thalassiosira rotula, Strain GSO102" /LENGTH=240 /DNA_ID=CAMNT_0041402179 /DNA_START=16 /DNA_END=738 /DNA_ORIENTATION=-